MSQECETTSIGEHYKWYQDNRFPLLPKLRTNGPVQPESKWDRGRTRGFTFRWLVFTAWTLDHPALEVGVVCSQHWGVGVIGLLPYLRWAICIPLTPAIATPLENLFRRKP